MNNTGEVPVGTNTYSYTASEANNLSNLLYTEQLDTKFLNNKLHFGKVPSFSKTKAYMNNPVNAGDARVNEYFSNMNREGTYYDTQEKVLQDM